jgi:hypothetical protein
MTDTLAAAPDPEDHFLFYQTEDGQSRVEVRLRDESVWLSLNQMARLFQRDKSVISKHIKNIFEEGELMPDRTVAKYATVQTEGSRQVDRDIEFYSLDVIIAVGYRVKSPIGTQFRKWATERLREYVIKGFTMDDARLKEPGGDRYFEELLARIRDIRSSERVFWRKVLDIYATSIDYDPRSEESEQFFKMVQNKMHWAAHGHTAAEIVHERADAAKPNMGLTSWAGTKPRQSDVSVAKNYLTSEELDVLNRIVTAYLEFAELQALNRKPMHMAEWASRLDDFLKLTGRDLLKHAGRISHEQAKQKAELEFALHKKKNLAGSEPVDQHFQQFINELGNVEKKAKAARKKKQRDSL